MPGIDLIFGPLAQRGVGGPVEIVFGSSEQQQQPDTVELQGAGRITGLQGSAVLRVAAQAMATGRISSFRCAAQVHWDANVSRGLRGEVQAAWQEAAPAQAALHTHWQASVPQAACVIAAWQDALAVGGQVVGYWQEADHQRAGAVAHWQEANQVRGAAGLHWQEADRQRVATSAWWQEATPRRGAVDVTWQEALLLRSASRTHWQQATDLSMQLRTSFTDGPPVWRALRPHWQEAMRPRAGRSDMLAPIKAPCYVPGVPVDLVFKLLADAQLPLSLVFICDGHANANPNLPGTIVVPALRSYIVINSVEIRRADSLASDPLPSETFSMQVNRQSWTWAFSASFHASARDALSSSPGGPPVELEVRVNGQPFRMQCGPVGRSRKLPEHLVTVSGRGRAAVLDAPHAPVQTFGNVLGVTAHQLMTDVLTLNGVGFGWDVDWQLTDWLVPGGVWMHQGTWISALADIAASVGGYLQPHDTAATLRVLPAWPKPWWDWGQLTPDFELPEGIAEVQEVEVVDQPGYNRIFVHGDAQGVFADLTRNGTPGDILKTMAIHPLITSMAAARQRASAELSESGRALKHKMTLPVLPWTGVIKPGAVLRYIDDDSTPRLGLVRSTSVSLQFPVLTQSLEIDSHV